MRSSIPFPKPPANGFTLAAVLVVMAAILLLAVGVLAVVGIERKTARSYVDVKRAEWMAGAGMEDVRVRLKELTANDDYLVISRPDEDPVSKILNPLDYLFIARGVGGGEDVSYEVTPLFSGKTEPEEVLDFDDMAEIATFRDQEVADLEIFPWADRARVSWIDVKDDDDQVVGRYAYWVEDLQGKLDAGRADSELARVGYPLPAPGVGYDEDSDTRGGAEAAFFALDPDNDADSDNSSIDDDLEAGKDLLLSPGSVLAAAGFMPPLTRDAEGDLEDELANSLERNVSAHVMPYEESPRVPFAPGISEDAAGEPKVNLNRLLLDGTPSSFVSDFANWVDKALPNFVDRKGGFPDDYLKTLAANALDYVDEDSDSTFETDSYRGLDAFPLISEHLVKYRWEGLVTEGGRKILIISGKVYAELWNMTDKEVSGDFQISYETNYSFPLGVLPELNLGSDEFLGDPEVASPALDKSDGYYWLPAQQVTMRPNEYRLVPCGGVTYRIDAGPASVWVASPLELTGEDLGQVGYRMKWNGVIVDQSRGNVKHPDMTINYPQDTQSKSRQGVWTTLPGHSYSEGRFDYRNNMGDPRMANYILINQDPNDYPDNYSPNRRTIRWGNVYQGDSSTKPKVYGRVMPSEWPDGGHNSAYGSIPAAVTAGRGSQRGDERIDPDDPQFFRNPPPTEEDKAPTRISNLGMFFSETELGRTYDPVMWLPTYEKASDTNRLRDGFMPSGQTSWPLVVDAAPPSDQYGGGNSLRIGRPEHPRFRAPGMHAASLLDLFHAGSGNNEESRKGNIVRMDGRVNLNTASKDVLQALAVGVLRQDPAIAEQLTSSHQPTNLMAPPTRPIDEGTPRLQEPADVIADAIIRSRPITSAVDLASVSLEEDGEPVFGNPEYQPTGESIEWNDSAAEEVFERVYNSSTVRSRNFRVWVIGQALAPKKESSTAPAKVLAESRKVFTIFADPGVRTALGDIDPNQYRPRVIYENDF